MQPNKSSSCMMQGKSLHTTPIYNEEVCVEEALDSQVSEFLHCCIKILNDPPMTKELTHLLTKWLALHEMDNPISTPLVERKV